VPNQPTLAQYSIHPGKGDIRHHDFDVPIAGRSDSHLVQDRGRDTLHAGGGLLLHGVGGTEGEPSGNRRTEQAGRRTGIDHHPERPLTIQVEAVGKDELIETVWAGTAVTDNALTRIVAQIRREIGDDARQPRFIQTLPTMGYRFVADVKVMRAAQETALPSAFMIHRSRFRPAGSTMKAAYGSFVRTPTWHPKTEEMVFEYCQIKGNVYVLNVE
jgi:hypothetical protein